MASEDGTFGERLQAAIVSRWEDLRDRSVFYQARVAIIVLYAVVVMLTVFIAPPRVADAAFHWGKVSFGASFVSYVEITNNDLGNLKDVTVEVRGEGVEFDGQRKAGVWTAALRRLPEGERTRLKPRALKDKKGYPAPNEIDVHFVTVRDEDGDIVAKGRPEKKSK